MIDERFAARVATWLRRTDRSSRQAHDNVAQAMAQIHHTRQQRRRLWFLPGPKPAAGADDREDRGRSMPSITTAPIGGMKMLFSPTKLVTTIAAATLAGVLLLAGPLTTQEPIGPAAPAIDSDTTGVTLVSGEVGLTSEDYPGDSEALDWGYSIRDGLNTAELTMSDDRLSGPARVRYHANVDDWTMAWTESLYLENEGGTWVGTGYGYIDPPSTGGELGAGRHERLVLEGRDGYAGLTAILDFDAADTASPVVVTGAIMEMDMPSMPGEAPTTFE